jgi:hypothetical protein
MPETFTACLRHVARIDPPDLQRRLALIIDNAP